MKTTFSSGVIVTSEFLNGLQQIYFDGQDLDFHYAPLGLNSLVRTGPNGLDNAYVTLGSEQPQLDATGKYLAGTPITGSKVVSGLWNFGYDPLVAGNPNNLIDNAPRSYTTNDKFDYANGTPTPTTLQKFSALNKADLVTKEVLQQWVQYVIDELTIDNGVYESASAPTCTNYSDSSGSDTVCSL